ncbi:mitochondrial glycine transporter A-like isoform X2 [Scylla paramamosain]|uniref:mitochondrial glycine transporter A-like isoform X2 n=1 Tax=Scylla paramamosain TaxID=85552 RepID=UPI003083286A
MSEHENCSLLSSSVGLPRAPSAWCGVHFSSLSWLKTTFTEGQAGPLQTVGHRVAARTFTGLTLIPITIIKTCYEPARRKSKVA